MMVMVVVGVLVFEGTVRVNNILIWKLHEFSWIIVGGWCAAVTPSSSCVPAGEASAFDGSISASDGA